MEFHFFPFSFLCSIFQDKCDSKSSQETVWRNFTVKPTDRIVPFQIFKGYRMFPLSFNFGVKQETKGKWANIKT